MMISARSTRPVAINRRAAIQFLATTAALVAGAFVTASSGGTATRAGICVPRDGGTHSKKGLANMTRDLAELAAEHFEPLVGETFSIGQYQATLRDVRRSRKVSARFREQFALVFEAAPGLPIRSELLFVVHPAIGRHSLLVTQIVDELDGTALEICFS